MVRLKFEVDAEKVKGEVLDLMEKELGPRRELMDRCEVERLVDEAIKACIDLAPPGKGRSRKDAYFMGYQFFFGMHATNMMFLAHSSRERLYVFPKWHSLHRCTEECIGVMKSRTRVMSSRNFYSSDLARKLSCVVLYDHCRRADVKELGDGLKRRREERKMQRALVREGRYDVEEGILKEYIKENYVKGRIMIQYHNRELCVFSEIYGEEERGYHEWFVKEVYVLRRVSGEEKLIGVHPKERLRAEKALDHSYTCQLLKLFARSEELSEEDRRVPRMLVTFEEL